MLLFDIGEMLRENGGRISIPGELKDMDIVGLGSPIYHMSFIKPMAIFLSELSGLNTKVKKAFYFGTYGGITSGKVITETEKKLETLGIETCGAGKFYAPHFWHTEGYPYEETREQVSLFATKMIEKDFRTIPQRDLRKKVGRMKPAARILYRIIPRISKKRELTITIDPSMCIGCGKCVCQCPTGAMSIEHKTAVIDDGKCIHCYHCTTICPEDAVDCETEKLKEFIKMNKKIIGTESPATRFWV